MSLCIKKTHLLYSQVIAITCMSFAENCLYFIYNIINQMLSKLYTFGIPYKDFSKRYHYMTSCVSFYFIDCWLLFFYRCGKEFIQMSAKSNKRKSMYNKSSLLIIYYKTQHKSKVWLMLEIINMLIDVFE